VDAEFSILMQAIDTQHDFQSIIKAHRAFITNVIRLSMIDNIIVQEGFERVFQVHY
jgi:hypothetical protein